MKFLKENSNNSSTSNSSDISSGASGIGEDINSNTKNSIEVEVKSGINGDGFKVIVKDADGHIIEQEDFSYGYNASYSRIWADKDKPFVTDIINSYLSKYNLSKDDLILTKGKNTFKDKDISDEVIARFRSKYLSESLTDDIDDKLLKIDTLYRDAIDYGVDPESLDKILYSNGANPDAPTFDIGLNVDKAYEELSNFLKKKYQSEFDRDYDDNDIPYDSYNILGFNKLAYKLELERLNKEIANLKDKYNINENKKELSNMRFLKENFSTRKEMIDWIEDHWNTRENSDYLYQVLGDLGLDIEDDSDEDEGFYANLTNDNLKRVIDILKNDTKPTDKEQVNMIKNAIKSVGRVVDMKDDGYGSDLATFDVLMDPENTYRVQIYKM